MLRHPHSRPSAERSFPKKGAKFGTKFPKMFRNLPRNFRRPHSAYQKVVQGKCPLHFLLFNGVVCSNSLFSNTSALTNSLLFMADSTCKILEHLFWSNTSGFQFWGPLARTKFLLALCGPPKIRPQIFWCFPGRSESLTPKSHQIFHIRDFKFQTKFHQKKKLHSALPQAWQPWQKASMVSRKRPSKKLEL